MFAWNDYLTLAESLASSQDEAALRTAISRAYYASFHIAQDLCHDLNIPVPRKIARSGRTDQSAHSRVAAALRSHPNGDLRHAGKLLAVFRKSRNGADYDLPFAGDVSDAAQKAILDAHRIIDALHDFYRGA
jgi:hypothetical protein